MRLIFRATPTGIIASVAISIIDDQLKITDSIKNAYDKLINDNNNLPEITSNGFLRVTMADGSVYSRPLSEELRLAHGIVGEPQGFISGDTKDNVLFGGDGDDRLVSQDGNDILIDGKGKDDYFVDYGDIIKDSDGKGRVFFKTIY